ncbi:MAG: sirohydrochlorin cobaltochelatase [Selenomonas sp.]|uniref:sirohydrochlorin cobaltochelatase n=1 Tax=Selenomonas sp. TaxID=2053611 RepID=UPI0025CCB445|nr:sirohydrochlorin cobaltochelatase [Selenomonas sp.]MCR5757658.1 sirohydrochlorin cobaltochelatase [Selenomonas sp.]
MKKAIVFASFGVVNPEARKACIDAAARQLQAAFPDWEVRQAYTSVFIKKRLAQQGIQVDSLPEALARLQADGFTHVAVQPGYLTAGEEYEKKVLQVVQKEQRNFTQLLVSRPLLERLEDGEDMLPVLQEIFPLPAGEELVLVGHGSPHQHNPAYENLQKLLDKDGYPAHIGVIEPADTPDFAAVLARLKARQVKKILLAPLLLSGGAHVNEDIAGEGAESWLNRLQAAGFSVRVSLRGLGEYPVFQQLYVKRLQENNPGL